MIRLPDKVPRLQHQRESTTPGTTSGTGESDQQDDQKDDQENRPRRQIVRCPEIVVAARIELAALKHRCHGTQPRHHAGAVISLPEIRQHVTHLDPLAKCIGQDAFQSRSGHEPHFPAIDDQENAQSVVRIGAADTPLGKKRMGEGEKIISANILHSDHGDLGQRPMPERIAKRVDLGDCRRGKNPVGIRREPITVADLHVGNLLHTVRPGSRTQKREQHSEAKYHQNYFFHLSVELPFNRFSKILSEVLSMLCSTSFIKADIKAKSISPLSVAGNNSFSRFIRSSFISRLKLYFSDNLLIIGIINK